MLQTEGMRFAVLLIIAANLVRAQDPRELVARAVSADDHSDRLARDYTYKVRNEITEHDGDGKAGSVRSTLDEVLYIGGKRYFRSLEKDGKPIPASEQRKDQVQLDRAVSDVNRMTEAERYRRLQEAEQERAKRRAEFKDVPDAFHFKLMGEVLLEGRAAYEIEATPRADYNGKHSNILRNIQGTVWIDKQDFNWIKFDGEVLNPIYLGWFLARIGKGAHISYDMTRVNDDLWVPKQLSLTVSARFALVKKINVEQKVTFGDYRKFQTDSRIIPTPSNP